MKDSNNSKTLIISIIVVAVLILGAIGASYAYFAPYISGSAATTATVKSNTVDNLVLRSNTAISLVLTQTNMAKPANDTFVNSTNTLWASSVLYPRNDAASTNSSCTYDVSIKTTKNLATNQTAGTLQAIILGCNNNGTVTTVDLTSAAVNSVTSVCTRTITATSTATITNVFYGVLQFKNSATVNQTGLSGQEIYTGQLQLTNGSCNS